MDVKKILRENDFKFAKKFGQNFLTDENLLDDIVLKSGVNESVTVVEIGAGAGTLTRAIAKRAKKVYAFEIDENLKPVLSKTLEGVNNAEVVFGDIMKTPIESLEEMVGEDYMVVANLPYYITTPVITLFLEKATRVTGISVTVQKEVALRLAAEPKTSDYGAITVAVRLAGRAEIIKEIGRELFLPPPNVDSAVVKISIDKNKLAGVDRQKYRELVRIAFTMRRKTLANNLIKGYGFTRDEAESALKKANLPVTVRGEELSEYDYKNLLAVISKT